MNRTRRYSPWILALVVFGLLVPSRAFSARSLQKERYKKARRHEAVIVLSNDDLPKNGRHFVMVEPTFTPSPPAVVSTALSTVSVSSVTRSN